MKRLCIETLRYENATFSPGSEYEVSYLRDRYLFLTGDIGITVAWVPIDVFRDYFI